MDRVDYFTAREDNQWTEKYEDKFDLILNCASGFSEVDFGSYSSV